MTQSLSYRRAAFKYRFCFPCLCLGLIEMGQPLLAIPQILISHVGKELVSQVQTIPFHLSVTRLDVYEDQMLPLGTPPEITPAVGHGVIRLKIENLTPEAVNFQIHQVEIRSGCGSVVMAQSGSAIALGGLQILEPGYHLTNQEGYQNTERVRAVVVYEFNDRTYTAESALTEVSIISLRHIVKA